MADLEVEKAKLISLAIEFGFDEETAKKGLDRLVQLYGKIPKFINPNIQISLSICTFFFFLLNLGLLC